MTEPRESNAVLAMDDPWGRVEAATLEREKLWSKTRTFLGDVWFRFRNKFTSIFGLALILLVLLFALAGPHFATFSYKEQNLTYVNLPPFLRAIDLSDSYFYVTSNLKLIELDASGHLLGAPEKLRADDANKQVVFLYNEQELTLDYKQKPYTIIDDNGGRIENRKFMWNKTYLLGSDSLGRDMMARLMYGAQISLLVAVMAALTNLLIGVLFGSISAYCGGMVDNVMMRIVDMISILPLTLYVILIKVFLDTGLSSIVLALGSVYWVNMARVVRAEILSLKQRDFVLASITIGSSTKTILLRHLIPNAMGPILVTLTMLIPQAIFMEAFLSFIGLGLAPPLASLGTMCSDALATLRTSAYQLFEPALLICILMFGFNFVGDGLRDALDPKLKK
jgi:oligopeptide transport system permease protein